MPDAATKVLVKRLCAGHQVLHLSAHGEFNRRDPLLSFVQLAPQTDDDVRAIARRYMAASEVEGYIAQWASLRTIVRVTPKVVQAWGRGY